eukprot:XP_003971934.2 PREDICTED: osteopetrosis-associated transmembrane protein 1 [Takifugu rubripes]
MVVRKESKTVSGIRRLTMSFPKSVSVFTFSLTLISNIYVAVCSDGLNPTDFAAADKLEGISLNPPAAASNSTAFKVNTDSVLALNLLSLLPEDQEISVYCRNLLGIFGQRYVASIDCFVPAARPVKVCQNCFSAYGSLGDIYVNISDKTGPGNESCKEILLHSDRLMLLDLLHNSLSDIWTQSNCDRCITTGYRSLTNDTLVFLATLNQTLTCFEKNQQDNQTELCKSCKGIYGELNKLYNRLDKSQAVCIDMEDSMNTTHRLWSTSFNCSVPRAETVPVIAVSSFMLFLPVIFYLSSFLHSEQKKRKLIHPKRAKSYNTLMNIQDKLS